MFLDLLLQEMLLLKKLYHKLGQDTGGVQMVLLTSIVLVQYSGLTKKPVLKLVVLLLLDILEVEKLYQKVNYNLVMLLHLVMEVVLLILEFILVVEALFMLLVMVLVQLVNILINVLKLHLYLDIGKIMHITIVDYIKRIRNLILILFLLLF